MTRWQLLQPGCISWRGRWVLSDLDTCVRAHDEGLLLGSYSHNSGVYVVYAVHWLGICCGDLEVSLSRYGDMAVCLSH